MQVTHVVWRRRSAQQRVGVPGHDEVGRWAVDEHAPAPEHELASWLWRRDSLSAPQPLARGRCEHPWLGENERRGCAHGCNGQHRARSIVASFCTRGIAVYNGYALHRAHTDSEQHGRVVVQQGVDA